MSFSADVKEELVKLRPKTPSLQLCQLAGLTHACGGLYVGRGTGAVYHTESLPVGRQIALFAAALYDLDATLSFLQREGKRHPVSMVTLTGDGAEKLLRDTGYLLQSDGGLAFGEDAPIALLSCEEEKRAFLRGLFLGCGSCADPYRGYHLELVTRSDALAVSVVRLIGTFSLAAKRMRRKERHIVYVKGDEVAGFLALIGANNAALAFENVRAERDFRNYVNRSSNCETANIGKTVNASAEQRRKIELIETHMGIKSLPAPLYEAALLRMNHPDATLQELADMAEIGKSGMNHRLLRLMRIAEEIENG